MFGIEKDGLILLCHDAICTNVVIGWATFNQTDDVSLLLIKVLNQADMTDHFLSLHWQSLCCLCSAIWPLLIIIDHILCELSLTLTDRTLVCA